MKLIHSARQNMRKFITDQQDFFLLVLLLSLFFLAETIDVTSTLQISAEDFTYSETDFNLVKRRTCRTKAEILGCPGEIPLELYPDKPLPVNGCGPERDTILHSILDQPWTTPCCNKHDACYSSCSSNFYDCNDEFRECLIDACKDEGHGDFDCNIVGDIFKTGVSGSFACGIYEDGVTERCYCPS